MVEFNPKVGTEDQPSTAHQPYRPIGRERFESAERTPHDGRSLVDLVKEMADEVRLLLRQEVSLARAEVMEKARAAARHASYIAIGGAVAYAGVLALIAAACTGLFVLLTWAGLGLDITLWLSPLIVGAVVAIIGYAMLKTGMNKLRKDDMVPHRTAQTMRENAAWMQERATR